MEDWKNGIAIIGSDYLDYADRPPINIRIEELYQDFKSRLLQELSEAGLQITPIQEPEKKKRANNGFQKPTIREIAEYCKERNNGIDAELFFHHYETNGWVQGKGKPIKQWKSAIITWEKNGITKPQDLSTKRTHASQKLWRP